MEFKDTPYDPSEDHSMSSDDRRKKLSTYILRRWSSSRKQIPREKLYIIEHFGCRVKSRNQIDSS